MEITTGGKRTSRRKTDAEWIKPQDVLLWPKYDSTKYSSSTVTGKARQMMRNTVGDHHRAEAYRLKEDRHRVDQATR